MILYINVKLFTLWLCLVTVNGLDGNSNEYVNEDRITRLSNHIESLKNLLDQSQRYNNNNQRLSSWRNIYNRQTDYDEYLRQYYIEPILNSLREISEQVNTITPPNNSPRPYFGQFPGQIAAPSPPIFGTAGGWGVFIPSLTQAHRISGDSGTLLSFPLNRNTNSNDSTALQPTGYEAADRFPIPLTISPNNFGATASGQSSVASGQFGSTSGQTFGEGQSFGTSSEQSSGTSGKFGSASGQPFGAEQSFGVSGRFGSVSGQAFGGGQSFGTASGQSFSSSAHSGISSDAQSHVFGSSFPLYSQPHQIHFGNALSNKQYQDSGSSSYLGGQSSYANSKPSVSISNRYPDEDDDTGKKWGIVEETDDDDDYMRPISLKSKTNAQSGCNCDACYSKNTKSSAIQLSRTVPKTAITCKAVVLSCCAPGVMEQDRRNCFAAQGCVRSYDTGLACLPVVIRAVYKELYANHS